jgi:DHA2 family multidrug resistance protein-like MFS transporter
VKETAAHGPAPFAALAVVVGLAAGWVFVRRQQRMSDPMLDVTLFTRRAFVAAVSLILLGLLALNGLFYLLPQFLQLVSGADPLVAGLWMLPVAAATVAGSLLTPRLARRVGRTRLLAVAAAVSFLGCVAIAFVGPDVPPAVLVGLLSVTVLGVVPTGVLGTDLVVGSVPPERAGSASAVSETAGELGVALGVAAAGSVVTAVYGARLGTELPAEVPAHAAAAAREGLAPALVTAESLPGAVGPGSPTPRVRRSRPRSVPWAGMTRRCWQPSGASPPGRRRRRAPESSRPVRRRSRTPGSGRRTPGAGRRATRC